MKAAKKVSTKSLLTVFEAKCSIAFVALSFFLLIALSSSAQNKTIFRKCDQPMKDGVFPCESDISMTQYLEKEIIYNKQRDSVGVRHAKTLFFILMDDRLKGAAQVTFVLRKTVSAEENTYKELERKVHKLSTGMNSAWIEWKFTRPDLYWVDAYVDDELFASAFVEIRKQ